MKIRISKSPRRRGGFSLVELLLTLVLILCLAAASVFTFTAVYQSSNLDEGSDRFQSLIRFAQAEAATTGRKVRLQFVNARPVELADTEAELRDIKVTWESDLLNAPGVFQEYTNKAWSEDIVNELVGVQMVKALPSLNDSVAPVAPLEEQLPAEPVEESDSDMGEGELMEEDFPSITFYPDGSCDSAEVVLASRNSDDERRLAVTLSGLLGSVSTRTLSAESDEMLEEESDPESVDAEYQDYNELFESSEPVDTVQKVQSEYSDFDE